ncbi:hypothetical protein [Polyangium sp. 15x6]|nr:hypothetical protein [Polyangium sp. 15x6]MDI3286353.1 hypothetical protein [Polyangium sp. 15x6]
MQGIPLGDGDRTVVLDLFKAKPSSPSSQHYVLLRAAPGGAAQP